MPRASAADGGAARHQGRHDARRRHATSWQIHLPTSNPAGCKPWHDTAAAATYSIQGYPAARVDMHLNRLHHRSHRGGQGFKSPQLHPNQQVKAMILALDDHGEDHLTVTRPSP